MIRRLVAGLLIIALVATAGEIAVRVLVAQDGFPSGLYLPDEALGYRLAPHFHGEYRKANLTVPLEINSWGMRDREFGPRTEGVPRILVLGDSMVFGDGMPPEHAFPRLLEGKLQSRLGHPVEVVNGGVPGYGTSQEIAFLERSVDAVQPDLVLWGIHLSNDIVDNMKRAALKGGGEAPGALRRFVGWLRSQSRLYDWSRRALQPPGAAALARERLYMETHAAELSPRVRGGMTVLEDGVQRLATIGRGRGVRLAALLIPVREPVSATRWQDALTRHDLQPSQHDPRRLGDRVRAVAEREGFRVLDLLPVLADRQNDGPLYFVIHWTALGHQVAAEAAADFLIAERLVR